jgi:hypothetical protein
MLVCYSGKIPNPLWSMRVIYYYNTKHVISPNKTFDPNNLTMIRGSACHDKCLWTSEEHSGWLQTMTFSWALPFYFHEHCHFIFVTGLNHGIKTCEKSTVFYQQKIFPFTEINWHEINKMMFLKIFNAIKLSRFAFQQDYCSSILLFLLRSDDHVLWNLQCGCCDKIGRVAALWYSHTHHRLKVPVICFLAHFHHPLQNSPCNQIDNFTHTINSFISPGKSLFLSHSGLKIPEYSSDDPTQVTRKFPSVRTWVYWNGAIWLANYSLL